MYDLGLKKIPSWHDEAEERAIAMRAVAWRNDKHAEHSAQSFETNSSSVLQSLFMTGFCHLAGVFSNHGLIDLGRWIFEYACPI